VLYSSEAFQRVPSGEFFLPQALSEIVDVARREKLEVITDVGMHIGPTSWKEIEDAVVEATNPRPKTANKISPPVVDALD
jgi:hypothetical protein